MHVKNRKTNERERMREGQEIKASYRMRHCREGHGMKVKFDILIRGRKGRRRGEVRRCLEGRLK